MDLTDIQLESGLAGLAELLDKGQPAPEFALRSNLFLFKKQAAKDYASRRGIKELIRPENARSVLPHLPGPGEHTHCALSGDFVLCDLIPAIIDARGRCTHLHIATLGLSSGNAATLAALRAKNQVDAITLICSHYFAQVDKTTTYRDVVSRLAGLATIIVTRCHAKVICLPTAAGDHFVIVGSANLRSSDNTEQMTIFNDAETLSWYRTWLDSLRPHA
jgi:hypothetical protein